MILTRSTRLAWLNFLLAVGLSGCGIMNTPTASQTADPQMNATLDAVVTLTMSSLVTDTPRPAMDTLTPIRTPTPVPPTAVPTHTALPPTPTATPVCDQAAAGNPLDVTITDDTQLRPGQNFTKIWRLENLGACTWTRSYAASFFYGAQMDAPQFVSLTRDVPSGESVEIMIDMVAPETPGTYQGNWKLRNAEGKLFGIGPSGDAPFWVRIVVIQVQTQTPTQTFTPSQTPSPSATPTATPTATPAALASGGIILLLDEALDLDSGAVNPASGLDFLYRKDTTAGFHLLTPQGLAVFGVIGGSEPTPAKCQAAAMSGAPLALESFSTGTYLCYRTDAAHFGWLRYDSLNATDESASFDFRTWAIP